MSELGWNVVGIEPDPNAARNAIAIGLTIKQCTIEDAELEPGSFDAITLHHVLEHLSDPIRDLNKLADCLKPGGVIVIITPNPSGLIARWFRNDWRGLEPPRHLVLPSSRGYKRMLEGMGFDVRVWTTMQTAFWMWQESMSIQRTGRAGNYRGWVWPKLLSSISSNLILPLFPNKGEEVVCVAVKS